MDIETLEKRLQELAACVSDGGSKYGYDYSGSDDGMYIALGVRTGRDLFVRYKVGHGEPTSRDPKEALALLRGKVAGAFINAREIARKDLEICEGVLRRLEALS